MIKQAALSAAMLTVLVQSLHANPVARQATITGGPSESGRCTVEVSVDGAAEVEISGDHGVLTTISGQPANWRRFQCTEPLPSRPSDFRFVGTDGRGAARLRQDPRNTGGRAVIYINDGKGGRGGYTFDLWWRRSGRGDWAPGPAHPTPGPWPGSGGFPMAKAIQICQDSVTNRLNRDGYSYVTFERTIPDNNPGRRDWITGTVSGKRRFENTRFSFSCSVDFGSGKVRSFDVRRY
jgi:hypothetical protein